MTAYRVRLDGAGIGPEVIKGLEWVASEFPGDDPIECEILTSATGARTLTLSTRVQAGHPVFRAAALRVLRTHAR